MEILNGCKQDYGTPWDITVFSWLVDQKSDYLTLLLFISLQFYVIKASNVVLDPRMPKRYISTYIYFLLHLLDLVGLLLSFSEK